MLEKLTALLEWVIPEESILFKACNTYNYYKDESDFENDIVFCEQRDNELFSDFITRLVDELIKDEEEKEEKEENITIDSYSIAINYAVHITGKFD